MAKTCGGEACEGLYVNGRPIKYCPYCGKPLEKPKLVDQV